jgi:hypothetical protein
MSPYFRDTRGAAAAEFAIWLGVLIVPFLNVVDIGFYCFKVMQVREAAQAAAQSAEALCGAQTQTTFPASLNCTGLSSQLTSAAQSTSLGTDVTVVTSTSATPYTTEGYYCADASGQLVATSAAKGTTNPWALSATSSQIPAFPNDCTGVNANNSGNPGDYLAVTVTYTYTPFIGNVSAAKALGGTVTETSWIRVG